MTAPLEDWVRDASTPTLKTSYFTREMFGDEPIDGYAQWVKDSSLATVEREYYIRSLLGLLPPIPGLDGIISNLIGNEESGTRALLEGLFDNATELAVDPASALRVQLDSLYMKNTGLVLDLSLYGVSPDNSDNTAQVQTAVNFLGTVGGGTIIYPRGEIRQRSAVVMPRVPLTITSNYAVLRKLGGDPTGVFFSGLSSGGKGYGAGVADIKAHDITFRGKFGANKRVACAFALHHAARVKVWNCIFIEMAGSGHRFDLQGCEDIEIFNNYFYGFDTSYNLTYSEDIQLDYSSKLGASATEPDPVGVYDGLPCRRIRVERNKWLPLTLDGVTYPAANPVGSHATVEGQYHTDIDLHFNHVLNPVNDINTLSPGTFHFMPMKRLRMTWNAVIDESKVLTCPAIKMYARTGGKALADVATDNASITYPVPMVGEDCYFEKNFIFGFGGTVNNLRVDGVADKYAKNIQWNGNIVEGYGEPGTGSATTPYFTYIDGFKWRNNVSRGGARAVLIMNVKNLDIEDNEATFMGGFVFTVRDCSIGNVRNNKAFNTRGSRSFEITRCVDVNVAWNYGEHTVSIGGAAAYYFEACTNVKSVFNTAKLLTAGQKSYDWAGANVNCQSRFNTLGTGVHAPADTVTGLIVDGNS